MSASAGSVFDVVNGAKPTEGGQWFEPDGEYVVMISGVKKGQSRKRVDFFVVECRIVESDKEKLKPRREASWMVMLNNDMAGKNIVGFVMAAYGCKDDEVDAAGVEEIVGKEQPLAGKLMRLTTIGTKTKAGTDFTVHKWYGLTEAELPKYEQLATELGIKK